MTEDEIDEHVGLLTMYAVASRVEARRAYREGHVARARELSEVAAEIESLRDAEVMRYMRRTA